MNRETRRDLARRKNHPPTDKQMLLIAHLAVELGDPAIQIPPTLGEANDLIGDLLPRYKTLWAATDAAQEGARSNR